MEKSKNSHSLSENTVAGRNAVMELLRSGRPVDRIIMERGKREGSLSVIVAKAAQRGIPVKDAAREKLDAMCPATNHQGVVAVAAMTEYCSVDDLLKAAEQKGEKPFIIICDGIEDPHNLGAIIRTAECCGAHGVVISKNRCCGVNFAVSKAACGATEYMPVARVANIVNAIDQLKEAGVWVYAADMDGTDYRKQDFSGAAALVVGSEGNGVSRLVKEKCDITVSLPMKGHITSLNASVAAGILMYAISANR